MIPTLDYSLPSPAGDIVKAFVTGLKQVHPGWMEAFYLTGSLSLADFHSDKSDIDFLVLCDNLPDAALRQRLSALHKSIRAKFHHPNLNGAYLNFSDVSTRHVTQIPACRFERGVLRMGFLDMAPVCLMEMKQNALAIFGTPAHLLQIHVTAEELNEFMNANIHGYWARWLSMHSSGLSKKMLLFLFPRFTEWVILGLCRQIYTLQTGKIISKTDAGIFMRSHLPVNFHSIVEEAIAIRQSKRSLPFFMSYTIKPSVSRLLATMRCSRYLIAEFERLYEAKIVGNGED